jgi:hypothetical protein
MEIQKIEKYKIAVKHLDFEKKDGNCKNYDGLGLVAGSRFELLISGSLGASELL